MINSFFYLSLSLLTLASVFGAGFGYMARPVSAVETLKYFPVPVACVGYACVTYSSWNGAIKKNKNQATTREKLLTELLTRKAVGVVASYEKVRISADETELAMNSIEKTIESVPGGDAETGGIYRGGLSEYGKTSLAAMLMREKLAAAGVKSPWESKYVPKVRVINRHLIWDDKNKRIMLSGK